ncbi:MAG TPA: hypothetical protein VMS76_12645 [Planctomycetota bacterium]|nr:hypothetical protein [Planctomycetota bacterium]
MKISVFLSYPKPSWTRQQEFVKGVCAYLGRRGLEPRTLGVTDYDMDAPLKAIRRLMLESNGLITIAFRRTLIDRGRTRPDTDVPGSKAAAIEQRWLTTPWAHIEPAMAYQIGLPILILREVGVIDDGILEKGVVGLYMPEFDLDAPLEDYFESAEWSGVLGKWEGYVRAVVERRGNPPQLY